MVSLFNLVIVFSLGFIIFSVTTTDSQRINSVRTIIQDMHGSHEAYPHGVPTSYDWQSGPRIGYGNDPKSFRSMTAWGQLYETIEGNPSNNTRVQFRHMKAYMLQKSDKKWYLLQSTKAVEGAAYAEDYVGDSNKVADVRTEPDGTISAKAGGGYNYHFWPPSGRTRINPNNIAGIYTTIQARLIIDDRSVPDDRASARYVLSMGGDYWLNETVQWDGFKTNGDIAIGKFKLVSTKWRAFNMCTMTAKQLLRNPPPLQ
jgi:hypothetical protein